MTLRRDPELYRMYGMTVDHATTVTDGPKVPPGQQPTRITPTIGADRPPDVLILEPEVEIDRDGMRLRWTGELGQLLAERLEPEEVHHVCQALGARICLDLWRVAHGVAQAHKDYLLARERALRAR